MSSIKWTNEQNNVIESRDGNLLVSAAAGSGKTAVLVERIIQMVTDTTNPIDIDRLLVVTFTNAAASEMKERIRNSLANKLDNDPNNKRIKNQLMIIGNANIMTIHSFCLKVIRNHINLLDIDPVSRIADEGETGVLREEIIEAILEEKYKEEGKDFIELSNWINTPRSNRNIIDLTLKIYSYAMSSPNPNIWLNDSLMSFTTCKNDFIETIWGKSIIENFQENILNMISSIELVIDDLNGLEGYEKYKDTFLDDKEEIAKLSNKKCNWDELYTLLREINFGRLPIVKKGIDKDASIRPKEFRSELKKMIGNYKEIISMKTEEINKVLNLTRPIIKELVELVIEFYKKYREKKRELKILDFNDIEHFCLELLISEAPDTNEDILLNKPSSIAKELSKRFYEILVDEYQDSNLVQETIITMVSRKNDGIHNIFMVGDVKQSIYRFRMARPDLFLNKYNSYSDDTFAKNKKINLYKNFRSQKGIIDFINSIFNKIMTKECGEIDYTEKEKLILGLESEVGYNPVLTIIENTKDEYGDLFLSDTALEATYIGNKINEIVNNTGKTEYEIYDKNIEKKRRIRYRDIVILMRSTSSRAKIFLEELGKIGIPVYADTNIGYFETIEIGIILSLLKIIDNPKQDIPLVSILRSGIGNFSDDELVELRLKDKNALFYDILEKIKDNNKKALYFLDKLNSWRSASKIMEIGDFIWYLYKDTGYYAAVSCLEDSTQRIANLRLLAYRATSFEKTSLRGLFSFISYIEKLKNRNQDYGSAKILGEEENLVRIMSIHKSKGLEFPVVFIPGLGKEFNKQDTREKVLMHQKLGFGPDYVSIENNYIMETPAKSAIKILIKKEALSEEMRILYVALTRARDYLFMVSSFRDIENVMEKYENIKANKYGRIPREKVENANSFSDWIIPCILNDSNKCSIEKVMKKDIIDSFKKEMIPSEQAPTQKNEIEDAIVRKENHQELNKVMNALFKVEKEKYLPQKISVTELKRLFEYQEEDSSMESLFKYNEYKEPEFIKAETGLSGAEKGKALHYVMQHIDFKNTKNMEDLELQILEMLNKEKLTKIQAFSINRDKILRFLNSNLGERAMKSDGIFKEVPFIIEFDGMLLQGIIDMFFEENNEYILVDYKTDFISYDKIEMKTNDYKIQLDYYKKALEKLTGKKVSEKYIYYFGIDIGIKIN